MKNIKKSVAYKPVLVLKSASEGNLFFDALFELSGITIIGSVESRQKAMRAYFKDVLEKYVKRLLVSEYPLRLTLKNHEALFIYDYAHLSGVMNIHFRGFLNEIHQNLII